MAKTTLKMDRTKNAAQYVRPGVTSKDIMDRAKKAKGKTAKMLAKAAGTNDVKDTVKMLKSTKKK